VPFFPRRVIVRRAERKRSVLRLFADPTNKRFSDDTAVRPRASTTTALRLVAGREEITEGDVRIGDCVVNLHDAPSPRDVAHWAHSSGPLSRPLVHPGALGSRVALSAMAGSAGPG
jgi:hypothetical protein